MAEPVHDHHHHVEDDDVLEWRRGTANEDGAEGRAEGDLAEVKPHSCRGIEKFIAMMDFVEAPQQVDFMAGAMPEISDEIEQHDVDRQADKARRLGAAPVEEALLGRLADGDGRERQGDGGP